MNRRALCRVLAASAAMLALFCCGGSITYSPDDDAAALKRLGKTWTAGYGGKTFSLTLCEDVEANAAFDVDGCKYAHLVRSVEPDEKRTVGRASSCERCFLGVLTNVRAAAVTPEGSSQALTGLVSLGTEYNEDPYDGDYGLMLYKDGRLYLEGRIQKDGALILSGNDLLQMGFEVDEAEETLDEWSEALCGGADEAGEAGGSEEDGEESDEGK